MLLHILLLLHYIYLITLVSSYCALVLYLSVYLSVLYFYI